jgi:hypothetical protein
MAVMIDGLKISCPYLQAADWLNNPHMSFKSQVDCETGEILDKPRTCQESGLTFLTKGNHSEMRGSLQKFYNGGFHNANDFNASQIAEAVQSLQRFGIVSKRTTVHNLEYGVNVVLPYPPHKFIKSLIAFRGKAFHSYTEKGVVIGKTCGYGQYELKIYDKGKQAGISGAYILRVEVSVKKMQYLNGLVTYLSDLPNPAVLSALGENLMQTLADLWVDEQMNESRMSQRQQLRLAKYRNSRNWGTLDKKERYRNKGRFQALQTEFATSSTKVDFLRKVQEKIQTLTRIEA